MRKYSKPLLLLAWLTMTGGWGWADSLDLNVKRRDSSGNPYSQSLSLDPAKTAVVVIDMWNSHPDPVAATRVHALVPRMNQTLDVARQLGMQVIFAPSDVLGHESLAGHARRAAVLALPNVTKPGGGPILSGHPPYDTDALGTRREMIPPGITAPNLPDPTRQDPDLIVRNAQSDWIVNCNNNQELWNVMAHKGITNLIYVGVHTNWCVWGRDSGVQKVTRELNVHPILVRDLTDAYTANGKHPDTGVTDYSWYPDRGTREVVAWYERNAFGTIDASQLLAREASNCYAYSNRVANEPGLLTYWRMGGKNGDKQIQDVKGTQAAWNTESVSLGQPGAIHGDLDTAAKFNGSAGVIVAPRYQANLPLDVPAGNSPLVSLSNGSFSVEAWVQLDALNGHNQWVLSHDAGSNESVDFLLGLNPDGTFRFVTRKNMANDLSSAVAVTQADVEGNRWFHLVGVQDLTRGVLDLYVNGQLVASKSSLDGLCATVQNSLQIGSRGTTAVAGDGSVTSSGVEFFNGAIDEVAIYGRALSAQEIHEHYLLGTTGRVPEPTGQAMTAAELITLLGYVWRTRKATP